MAAEEFRATGGRPLSWGYKDVPPGAVYDVHAYPYTPFVFVMTEVLDTIKHTGTHAANILAGIDPALVYVRSGRVPVLDHDAGRSARARRRLRQSAPRSSTSGARRSTPPSGHSADRRPAGALPRRGRHADHLQRAHLRQRTGAARRYLSRRARTRVSATAPHRRAHPSSSGRSTTSTPTTSGCGNTDPPGTCLPRPSFSNRGWWRRSDAHRPGWAFRRQRERCCAPE